MGLFWPAHASEELKVSFESAWKTKKTGAYNENIRF